MDNEAYIFDLEEKVTTLTRLLEVTTALNSALLSANVRVDSLLSFLMDSAAEITDSEAASVLLWNNNTHELFFAATTSDNPGSMDLIGKPVPLDSIAGTILRERRHIVVDDTQKDERHYTKVDEDLEFVTRSLLGVPMISKDRVIGVLEVVNKRTLPWNEPDVTNLSILAEEAAVAIEVAQLVVALRKANNDLKELDKLKSDFIAIASHELRTPLGVIMGYASFLQEEQDESISSHATKVMESALQLRSIIEGMVNLRYVKQSASGLRKEPVLLSDLLDDARRDITSVLDLSHHKISVPEIKGGVKVPVDRARMAMALNNLLSNAVKFTPPGGEIKLDVEFPAGKGEVWISVTDNGAGLEADKLDRIFDEFYQVEDHMTRHHGGLGIGLSISRALVKAHGGRIWASSPGLGEGATFTVSLPLAE